MVWCSLRMQGGCGWGSRGGGWGSRGGGIRMVALGLGWCYGV